MKGSLGFGLAVIAAAMLSTGAACLAQSGSSSGGGSSGMAGAVGVSGNIGRGASPHHPENLLVLIRLADRLEESAFREFQHASTDNTARKTELGEKFLKPYPQSGYRALAYSGLTSVYPMTDQVQEIEEADAMPIALSSKDVQVLAMREQTIPRKDRRATCNGSVGKAKA